MKIKNMAYWLFSPSSDPISPTLAQSVLLHEKKKKEGRTCAKSAVDALFLDYTDHDSDKDEMMTDAAVISKPLRKIGGIFQT